VTTGQIQPHVIRVLIADDHFLVRDGLKVFLKNYADIEVIGEASDGKRAGELCADLQPDVVLMDLVMPVMDGTTAIRLIHQRDPRIRILALTSFQERRLVEEAVQAGAAGFLYKDCAPEDLAQAIRTIHAGRPALSPSATEALMQAVARPADPAPELSPRELEVLALVARGSTNAEIAKALTLSLSTVGFHISNIIGKLGAGNRTEAVSIARKYHLIPLE
jgi:two-component system, NarL family, response regulator LiaR